MHISCSEVGAYCKESAKKVHISVDFMKMDSVSSGKKKSVHIAGTCTAVGPRSTDDFST